MVGIAYTGPNGDFAPDIPYIVDAGSYIDDVLTHLAEVEAGNVTLFYYPGEGDPETPECISWDYVKAHLVVASSDEL